MKVFISFLVGVIAFNPCQFMAIREHAGDECKKVGTLILELKTNCF